MSDFNRFIDTQSSPDDDISDDTQVLDVIEAANLPDSTWNVEGSSHYDNKARQDQNNAIFEARKLILGSKDRPMSYWRVFERVYDGKLRQDQWSGTLYYNGKSTTFSKLTARLEDILSISRPRAAAGFYEGQLDRILECWQFNPVKYYLDGCYRDYPEDLPEWDNLAEVLFGVKDALTQEMITSWLVGAVKRVLTPGCFMKRSLIFKGAQDAGKSAFVSILAKSWGTELPPGTGDMDFIRLCTRTWIMELGECDRLFKGKEASILKQQLSTTVDKYVPKYKEADGMVESPRITMFIGTTNKDQFLVDETGNKRFWVIGMADGWKLPIDWLKANVDQLWATAYRKLADGHQTDLSAASQELSEIRNRDYMVEGSWVEQLEEVLVKGTLDGSVNIAFKLAHLMNALRISPDQQGKHKSAILGSLKQLGYEQKAIKVLGKTEKLYCIKGDSKPVPAKHEGSSWLHMSEDRQRFS